ncbi:zinc ABC transporter substrate-binding protein [Paracoccus sanguinis]|uniref:High-affinity zinc uptake system protein ZnuA n=1 Tax=Paracoccus sanguinis TaxID=1545044 RepID=A0A1H2XYC2_9RHOB|nr:zinc ABC transporter substrate-binding protein [Paracoccus sanguinis]KGJ15836.1 hypothetical protein IX57_14835 [Paracoccus sanguinis]SDW97424.1 zinc transport system substrate-binding protein [Paracoccus sanguinis]
MSRSLLAAVAASFPLALGALPALAEGPRVVADVAPVHGLVARVMQGVGEPALLVRPGASPHGYAMKPSEAGALEAAQVVFFVGPELTPWLMRPIESLAPKAKQVELLAAPGTVTLPTRTGATFAPHDHGDEGHDHGAEAAAPAQAPAAEPDHDHDHADHDHDHDHAAEAAAPAPAAEDHDHAAPAGDDHDHAHSHDGIDPHAWLDPENGKAWTRAIAATLAELDPDHAAAYAANAEAAVAEIDAAEADTRAALAPLGDLRFVAFHDAYQYLETRFGVSAAGSVSLSDASAPSPARIAELRQAVAAMGVSCALSEPQFDADLLNTVFDGTGVKTAVIDPVGAAIPAGPAFYPTLIRSLGTALTACR